MQSEHADHVQKMLEKKFWRLVEAISPLPHSFSFLMTVITH